VVWKPRKGGPFPFTNQLMSPTFPKLPILSMMSAEGNGRPNRYWVAPGIQEIYDLSTLTFNGPGTGGTSKMHTVKHKPWCTERLKC
jgi:hypothetical protein